MSRAIAGFVVIAFVAGFALSSGCAGKTSAPGPNQSKPEISVDHILDSPQDFIGDRVRLSGDVAEPHGERMFTLQDDDAINKEQMLVVTRRPVSRLLGEERTTLEFARRGPRNRRHPAGRPGSYRGGARHGHRLQAREPVPGQAGAAGVGGCAN